MPDFSSIPGHLHHGQLHNVPAVERRMVAPRHAPTSSSQNAPARTAAPASEKAKSVLAGPTARRTKLDSEHIQSAGWKNGNLFIRFTSGPELYVFANVPEKKYKDFLAAKSHGKFFSENIKGRYPFTKRAK